MRTVCLDNSKPLAREYVNGDIHQIVTVPDVSPSLYQMISTATVGSMPGNSPNYKYPDLGEDDDQAHDHPDYEKLNQLDIVEKESFVESWLEKPENYEKKEVISKEAAASKIDEQSKEDETAKVES